MVVDIAIVCLSITITLAIYRVLRGPTWGDRVTAFDFLGVALAVLLVVIALKTGTPAFLDAALVLSILGFLGTAALSRYMLHGRVMK